jgi:hypothetical protein
VRARWPLLVGVVIATACGGKVDVATDGGADGGGGDVATSGMCCPPSPSPGCCMSFGGWAPFCGTVCDGMPTPDTPGWKQLTDAHGCTYWQPPANATTTCGGVLIDASPPPPSCPTPADVSTFTAPAFTPPAVKKGACTDQQIQDLYAACFASNATACNSFEQNNAACAACVMTTPNAPGPLVQQSNGIVALNVAGCVAIVTGDSSSTSCAAGVQANFDCEGAACDAQCPVVDQPSFQLYQQCTQAAEAGGCSKYAQAQCGLDAGASQCAVQDFKDGFFAIVPLLCGP